MKLRAQPERVALIATVEADEHVEGGASASGTAVVIPAVVIPIAVMTFSTQPPESPHWHLVGNHHDPVVLVSGGAVVGLFLVVVVVGYWTSVRYVRRPLS